MTEKTFEELEKEKIKENKKYLDIFENEMRKEKLSEKTIKGSGRINYDDDLVRVYKDGEEIYSGLEEDEPMNSENWKYDSSTKSYKLPGGYSKILV